METQEVRYRRQRSSSEERSSQQGPLSPSINNTMKPRRTRKARRDRCKTGPLTVFLEGYSHSV